MNRRPAATRALVAFVSLVAVAALGCAGPEDDGVVASDTSIIETLPTVPVEPVEPGVMATVPDDEATFFVVVSNQSYDRKEVGLRVEVDGLELTDRSFAAGSGHNFVPFALTLPAGAHQVTVVADDGTRLDLPLDLPAERRWLMVDYWSGGDRGTEIGHELFDTQPAVA